MRTSDFDKLSGIGIVLSAQIASNSNVSIEKMMECLNSHLEV